MQQPLTLQADPRSVTGKQVQALRRQGITPIHLYGKGIPSLALQADSSVLLRLIARAGRNLPVSVSVKGTQETHLAFIREMQRHPLTEAILHVDFFQVSLAEIMRAEVPVYLRGEAPALRSLGGNLLQALYSIQVECLPLDLPQFVELDVSGLTDYEKALYVSDIKLKESVTILTGPNDLIARVNPPRVVEEVAAPTAEAVAAPETPTEGEQAEGTKESS